jgi:hypothetical protein
LVSVVREQHKLRVLKSMWLRKIFRRREVLGDWGKLFNEGLHDF